MTMVLKRMHLDTGRRNNPIVNYLYKYIYNTEIHIFYHFFPIWYSLRESGGVLWLLSHRVSLLVGVNYSSRIANRARGLP